MSGYKACNLVIRAKHLWLKFSFIFLKQIVSRVLFCNDFPWPYCQRVQQMGLKKNAENKMYFILGCCPKFSNGYP